MSITNARNNNIQAISLVVQLSLFGKKKKIKQELLGLLYF